MKPQTSEHSPKVDKDSFDTFNDIDKTRDLHDRLLHLPDMIIQTDLEFIITGWNKAAAMICGITNARGKNIFDLDEMIFSASAVEKMKTAFREDGTWNNNIRFKRQDGNEKYFRSAAHYILDDKDQPAAIVIACSNICRQINAERKLEEIECIYKLMIDACDEGVLLIGASGMIIASNKKASQILLLSEEHLNGKIPVSAGWKVFRPDGKHFPDCELPAVVSLLTGFPQKNVDMRLEKANGESIWISVSSQALIREGEFNPYAVVVSFTSVVPQ